MALPQGMRDRDVIGAYHLVGNDVARQGGGNHARVGREVCVPGEVL